jgi:F-type H+-transporting ATPase subunit b
MLEIDATFLVTFVLVWILVAVLTRVFWRPLRKVMDERQKGLEKDQAAAKASLEEVGRSLQEVDRAIKTARTEAERLRSEIEAEALKEKARLLAEAGAAAKAEVDRARAELEAEVARLKEALRAEAAPLAERIEKKLLHGLGLPFLAFLSEEGPAHGSAGSGMLGKVVNFVILFGALIYFLWKPAKQALAKRTDDIRSSLESAREARLAAEAKLGEARGRLAALDAELSRIKTLAEKEASVERDRLRSAAEAETARIRTLAGQDIEARFKAGVRELKIFAAELAAGLAEARLKARMTDDLHGELIDRSIERLGRLHEESGSR